MYSVYFWCIVFGWLVSWQRRKNVKMEKICHVRTKCLPSVVFGYLKIILKFWHIYLFSAGFEVTITPGVITIHPRRPFEFTCTAPEGSTQASQFQPSRAQTWRSIKESPLLEPAPMQSPSAQDLDLLRRTMEWCFCKWIQSNRNHAFFGVYICPGRHLDLF